ncbi:MAG: leucine-rich repeat domain-containing protein [Treponema sp.]|nr:leucine-rich repeat domain-containing protein [Treponema sp.]
MNKWKLFFPALFFLCAYLFPQASSPSTELPDGTAASETVHPAETADVTDFELLQNRFGGITIIAYNGADKNVVIPETIGGLPVTIIGTKAFFRKELLSVVIPGTVVTIEPMAFAENHLQSIDISGCVSIGYESFADNQLSTLVLSEHLSSIGPRAFINNKLSSITIPGKITNIGKDAFAGNPLSLIKVGANRNLFASQGFEPSFVNYYIGTGRGAGVYAKNGRIWSLQENNTQQ